METLETQVAVLGGGPGGYAAAFLAADLGKKVVLIEKESRLGGVCLNRGCMPSKALLHAVETIHEARLSEVRGIEFDDPKVDLDKLRSWKDGILNKLGGGLAFLAKKRGVDVVQGTGRFAGADCLEVETAGGAKAIRFEQAIVATGSRSFTPESLSLDHPHVMTSRQALELEDISERLLVIGGGYIGMELGFVYAGLGSKVTVIEELNAILSGTDADLIKPVVDMARKRFDEIRTGARVASLSAAVDRIQVVSNDASGEHRTELYDRVLVSVGRRPNSANLGLENTGVEIDDDGFLKTDTQQRTSAANIYAIGDVTTGPMLAHKAHKDARRAVESICGEGEPDVNIAIPAVVFTDPEVAWCGLTEAEAIATGVEFQISKFPWAASGRALTLDRPDGLTKLVIDPETERILGVGMVGRGAGELIAEAALAIEMDATALDLATTVHPHPTLSETLKEAAEAYYGTATHTLVKPTTTARTPGSNQKA